MKKFRLISLFLMLISTPLLALSEAEKPLSEAEKSARVTFANEFIRELYLTQKMRDTFERDHAEDHSNADTMRTMIRTSTRIKLELQANLAILAELHLDPFMDQMHTALVEINKQKIAVQEEIINTASVFISGPKPNIDYDALLARTPQLTAKNDYLDEMTFDVGKLVSVSLIDMRPDSQGHASHLILSDDQRRRMLDTIETLFRSTADNKDKNYTTSAAWLVHDVVLARKSSDDPW